MFEITNRAELESIEGGLGLPARPEVKYYVLESTPGWVAEAARAVGFEVEVLD